MDIENFEAANYWITISNENSFDNNANEQEI